MIGFHVVPQVSFFTALQIPSSLLVRVLYELCGGCLLVRCADFVVRFVAHACAAVELVLHKVLWMTHMKICSC